MYELEIRPRARREFHRFPTADRERILRALMRLRGEPRGKQSVKLRDNIYRVRVGPFRIVFQIRQKDRLVVVGKIDRREKDTYDRIEELF